MHAALEPAPAIPCVVSLFQKTASLFVFDAAVFLVFLAGGLNVSPFSLFINLSTQINANHGVARESHNQVATASAKTVAQATLWSAGTLGA